MTQCPLHICNSKLYSNIQITLLCENPCIFKILLLNLPICSDNYSPCESFYLMVAKNNLVIWIFEKVIIWTLAQCSSIRRPKNGCTEKNLSWVNMVLICLYLFNLHLLVSLFLFLCFVVWCCFFFAFQYYTNFWVQNVLKIKNLKCYNKWK